MLAAIQMFQSNPLSAKTAASAAIDAQRHSPPIATIWHSPDCPIGYNSYVRVTVVGLKDRRGDLRVELYPDTEQDFVVNMLARVELPTPPGDPTICVALPEPGRYAIAVHHDRNTNNKFDLFTDGFGFSNNPRLGLSLPKVDKVAFDAGPGKTNLTIRMRYVFGR
jgi:uncharacterized protein (DUF2141 family)